MRSTVSRRRSSCSRAALAEITATAQSLPCSTRRADVVAEPEALADLLEEPRIGIGADDLHGEREREHAARIGRRGGDAHEVALGQVLAAETHGGRWPRGGAVAATTRDRVPRDGNARASARRTRAGDTPPTSETAMFAGHEVAADEATDRARP